MTDAPQPNAVQGHILRGPDGGVYVLSDENLQAHRVSEDVGAALLDAYEAQAEVSGFAWGPSQQPTSGSFQIIVSGPIIRSFGPKPSTPDNTFFDPN